MRAIELAFAVTLSVFAVAALFAAGGADVEKISLPGPVLKGKMSLEEAVSLRRSVRSFKDTALSEEVISQLAWAAQGITEPRSSFRAAPSAGALYPLEIYLVKADGVFHYIPDGHRLERISEEDVRKPLARAALSQSFVAEASLDIVIAAEFSRTTGKYGQRGHQYVHMEAGYVAENVHLQAVALGLGSVSVGAFRDAEVSRAVGLPGEYVPLLIIPVGYADGF